MNQQTKWRARRWLSRLGVYALFQNTRAAANLLLKRDHEPDFRFFTRLEGDMGLFVDIGANAGQSALSFRCHNHSMNILSFEPNRQHAPGLKWARRLLGKGFDYRLIGLGNQIETRTLYIPQVNGVPFTEEATFKKELLLNDPFTLARIQKMSGQSDFEIQESFFEIRTLDEFALNPAVIKIDVQGFELEAIQGMTKTLERAHPILLIENGPGIPEIAELLGRLGFSSYVFEAETCRLRLYQASLIGRLNAFFLHSQTRQALEKRGFIAP